MSAPSDIGYRFLQDYEKDGRYSHGRSEFWNESERRWVKAGVHPGTDLIYRVSTDIHNPEGLLIDHLRDNSGNIIYRFLTKDELDGRFNGKAEFSLGSTLKSWEVSTNAFSTNITYRVKIPETPTQDPNEINNPEKISAELIDFANYRLVTSEEKRSGKWARKCQYWDPDDKKWVTSFCGDIETFTYRLALIHDAVDQSDVPVEDNPEKLSAKCIDLKTYRLVTYAEKLAGKWKNVAEYWSEGWYKAKNADTIDYTYRLHRSYDVKESVPSFPTMPEEFKLRHFTLDEVNVVCALFGAVDIPKLLVHWQCKEVPGMNVFVYDPPEVVKELTIQEKLPEFFTIDQLADALGNTYKALDMYANGQVIPVPGSAEALMFAPKKEEHVVRSSFELFKEAMTPMFSIDDAYAFGLSEREFNNFLQEKLIVKMTGLEFYKFNN